MMQDQTSQPENSDLPPIEHAEIGADDFDRMLSDLSSCAVVESIIVKARAQAAEVKHLPPTALAEIPAILQADETSSVQLRYTFEKLQYVDTIRRMDGGYSLVRMQA